MTAILQCSKAELSELYEVTAAAKSLKGFFVDLYVYGRAVSSSKKWEAASKALAKLKKQDADRLTGVLLERHQETTAWYAWEKIETFCNAYEGRPAEAHPSDEFFGNISKVYEFELGIILKNELCEEDLLNFCRDHYKGYLSRFHRWLMGAMEDGADNLAASSAVVPYHYLEEGGQLVIKTKGHEVSVKSASMQGKILQIMLDAGGDTVSFEELADELEDDGSLKSVSESYFNACYRLQNAFARKGILGFIDASNNSCKINSRYKHIKS